MVCVAGITPQQYWRNTLRQNLLLIERKKNEEQFIRAQQRQLEYYLHFTTFAGMSGEQVFRKTVKKPEDLYGLEIDKQVSKKRSTAEFDPEAAIAAYNRTEKDKEKWLHQHKSS